MIYAESDVQYINDAIATKGQQQKEEKPPPTGERAAMMIEGESQQAEHAETDFDGKLFALVDGTPNDLQLPTQPPPKDFTHQFRVQALAKHDNDDDDENDGIPALPQLATVTAGRKLSQTQKRKAGKRPQPLTRDQIKSIAEKAK